jgi:hypothetical protein
MKKFVRIAVSILLPFAVGAFSSMVNADQKVYPGSMGVKFSGPSPSYYFSTIGNPSSTTTMSVDLPAVNDTNTAIESSWVRVLDRHYSSGVSCSLNTAYWNNTYDTFYGSWGALVTSAGSSNDVQVLNTGTAHGSAERHIYFGCAIPATYSGNLSHIVSYSVDE